MNKAEYVKSQGQTRAHHCHWPGCEKQVPPAMWGCKAHWFMLPLAIRTAIWNAYKPGQEKTMTPSRAYVDAAQDAQDWIRVTMQERQAHKEAHGDDNVTQDLFGGQP
jgi:hypothetical protein